MEHKDMRKLVLLLEKELQEVLEWLLLRVASFYRKKQKYNPYKK
jgi:hypothetical protein